MIVSLSKVPRADRVGVLSNIEDCLDQSALFALFVVLVGLLLTRGPAVLMRIAGSLAPHLRSAASLLR